MVAHPRRAANYPPPIFARFDLRKNQLALFSISSPFACGNFRLLCSNHNGGIVPSAALLSSSSRSLTKVNLQLPFWGDVSFFSRCEAAFLKTQTKPDPSERPPTNNQAPCSMPRESSEKPFKDARNSITILGFFLLFCLLYCFQKIEAFRLSLPHSSQQLQMVLELIVRSPYGLQFRLW